MAKNIRISDSLYRLALRQAQLQERSIAQQIEYWAKLGMAVGLCTQEAQLQETQDEVKDKMKDERKGELKGEADHQKEKCAHASTQEREEFLSMVAEAAKTQEKDRQNVKEGKISARSLFWFTEDFASKVKIEWPESDFSEFNYEDIDEDVETN